MARSRVTLEELSQLLPGLEDLDWLHASIVGVAVPDPNREWERSQAYATVDKRVVGLDAVLGTVDEAEQATTAFLRRLFECYRSIFHGYWRGDDAEVARLLVRIGEEYEGIGRLAAARRCYEAALRVALPLAEKGPQLLALRRIARVAQQEGLLNEAYEYYRRCATLAADAGLRREEVIALTGTGNALSLQGRWEEAERAYREAVARLHEEEPASMALQHAQLLNNLGMVELRQNRFAAAEATLAQAEGMLEVLDSPVDHAICAHNRAMLREKEGRLEEAQRIWRGALEAAVPSAIRAIIAIDLAQCLAATGQHSEAERWGRVGEQHAIAARSPYHLGYLYRGLGNICRVAGDPNGIVFFEKAVEIARNRELPLLEGVTLIDYALLRGRMGEADEGRAYLERACGLLSTLGTVDELQRARDAMQTLAAVPAEIPEG